MLKRSNEISLKEAFEELVNQYGLKPKLNEWSIKASWAKLMGPHVDKATQKIVLSKQTLIVELNSAPLRQELIYASAKIIKLLNQEAGAPIIDKIVFR
ncbi:MAG: hypothetical protein RIQ89_562 [Bacteroidota bacterium]